MNRLNSNTVLLDNIKFHTDKFINGTSYHLVTINASLNQLIKLFGYYNICDKTTYIFKGEVDGKIFTLYTNINIYFPDAKLDWHIGSISDNNNRNITCDKAVEYDKKVKSLILKYITNTQ